MRYHVSVFALTAGLLSPMSGSVPAMGQQSDVDRTEHGTSIERRTDGGEIERREQDNLAIEALSDDDIALIIRLLGPDDLDQPETPSTAEEAVVSDGVPPRLHQIADQIGAAYASERFEDVFRLLESDPEVRAARPEVNVLEAWSAFKLGRHMQAMDVFGALYLEDPSASNAIGLLYSAMRAERFTYISKFATQHGGPLANLVRPGQPVTRSGDLTRLDDVHREFLEAWLGAAVKYQQTQTIDAVSRLLGIKNPTLEDAGFQLSQAWHSRSVGETEEALSSFQSLMTLQSATGEQRQNAALGVALSLRDLRGTDAALDFMTGQAVRDEKLEQLYRETLLAKGYEFYDQSDFNNSLLFADQADTPAGTNRKAQLLAAWSKFQLENYESAATDFERLYRSSPDKESADGVRASFSALNRRSDLNQLAMEVDGPLLVAEIREPTPGAASDGDPAPADASAADQAFYRGQFLTAALGDAHTYGGVAQTGTPWFGATLRYQYRDGEQGLGEFELLSQKFSLYQSTGRHHLRADVELALLDSGGDPLNITLTGARVLPEPGPRPFETTTDGTVVIPSFHWRMEGDTELEASIGATPIGGEVDPTVTGHFDVKFHNDGAVYTIGAHRRSIYESILSLSGIQDPATGQSYGRVVETGGHAAVFQPLLSNWSLSGEARWGERTGDQVADNNNVFATLNIAHDFRLEGFSYFSAGPTYRYESFDENLSQFTHGHGGYYSPSALHNFGAALNFLTDEGKTWIVKGSGSLAYETAEQDQAPFYPLDVQPFDPFYAATDSSGAAATAQLQGAWLLYDRVIAEAGAYALEANDYSEHGVFFKIRVTLGDRSELYRTDLTERLFRRYH